MKTYLISYDLRAPGRNYLPVYNYLQSFAAWAKPLESVYMIQTSFSADQIRNNLQSLVDANDRVLVIEVMTTQWASLNLPTTVVQWLGAK